MAGKRLLHNRVMGTRVRLCLGSGAFLLGVVLLGCDVSDGTLHDVERESGPDSFRQSSTSELFPLPSPGPLVVALGDSLTAGLGLDADEVYPALLEHQLRTEGYELTVVNAGVSGDTTAAGLRRVEWVLEGDVRVLILALGGNDGLRGLPVAQMKRNLDDIISFARDRGVVVLLAGMEAPPNFGAVYTTKFRNAFSELAREHEVAFLPFLLDGIAGEPTLNQDDQIHPNAEGAALMAEHVHEALVPLLTVFPAVTR